MIKIFIGKRDYRHTLKVLLRFINDKSPREFTYSTDNDKVDVGIYLTLLLTSGLVREHSEESPEDIFVHIEEGIGIYVDGEVVSIDVLEDYMRRME